MARRPAEGFLTGALVFRPDLERPLWCASPRAIGWAGLPLFVVLLPGGIELRRAGDHEVLIVKAGIPEGVSLGSTRSSRTKPDTTTCIEPPERRRASELRG